MGYEIKVDGEDNRGLQVWLTAMQGLCVDVQTHDMPFTGRGQVYAGSIVRVDPVYQPDPEVMLIAVDMHGRPIEGGQLKTIKVDHIKKVAVW